MRASRRCSTCRHCRDAGRTTAIPVMRASHGARPLLAAALLVLSAAGCGSGRQASPLAGSECAQSGHLPIGAEPLQPAPAIAAPGSRPDPIPPSADDASRPEHVVAAEVAP
jgi:hypothetical protein